MSYSMQFGTNGDIEFARDKGKFPKMDKKKFKSISRMKKRSKKINRKRCI